MNWPPLPLAIVLSGVLLAGPSPARADEVADLERQVLARQARRDALTRCLDLLQGNTASLPPRPLPPIVRDQLSKALAASTTLAARRQAAEQAAQALLREAGADAGPLFDRWEATGRRWREARLAQERLEARLEGSLGEEPPLLPHGRDAIWLGVWTGAAILAGLLLARGEYRRATSGRSNRSDHLPLALLALATAGAWLVLALHRPVDPGVMLATADRQRLQAEATMLTEEIGEREAQLRQQTQRFDAARAGRIGLSPQVLTALEGEVRHLLVALLEATRLNDRLVEGIAERERQAGDIERRVAAEQVRHADWLRQRGWLRAAACAGIIGLALLPWLAVRVTLGLRRWRTQRLCPVCGTDSVRDLPGGEAIDRLVGCAACGYRIPRLYRALPRLRFHAVGLEGSGKTHWLVEAYHQLSRGIGPAAVTLEPLGPPAVEAALEAAVHAVWDRHQPVTAVGTDLGGSPLIVHFKDRLTSRSAALLHLFDPAADLPSGSDGLLLFLDATRPEETLQSLETLLGELYRRLAVAPGRPLPLPVAVCLSRLDLLPTRTAAGERWLPWLELLRQTMRSRVDLAHLSRRSDLVRQQVRALFPAGNVARLLDRGFPGRHLFFPLTPLGIAEDEALLRLPDGDAGRSDRAPLPFAILEPLLWLLHRRGYDVFD